MTERDPSYESILLREVARNAQREVHATEEQLIKGRIAMRKLVDALYGLLFERTRSVLEHAINSKRTVASNLFKNAVNNFNDFKNDREPLNPGYQILLEVDGEHFTSI